MNKTKKKKITKVSNDTSAILIVAAMILVDDLPENFK